MTAKLSTTSEVITTPICPGEILAEEIAEPGISITCLARDLDVPTNRLTEIVAGRQSVTADTALRLSAYLGTSARFWMNLQATYDWALTRQGRGELIVQRVRPAKRFPWSARA